MHSTMLNIRKQRGIMFLPRCLTRNSSKVYIFFLCQVLNLQQGLSLWIRLSSGIGIGVSMRRDQL